MTRTALLIVGGALLVGLALVGGVTLIASNDNGRPGQTPQGGRAATDERGPEAEDPSVGELPDVEAATRRFLAGYLPLIYGKPGASVDRLRSASPRLTARLKADPGRVPPGQAALTPRLERVSVIADGAVSALATAQIKDSSAPAYPLVFHLQKTPEGWVVTRIGGP